MSKSKPRTEPERIVLTFDLHELPTAQHRAGLAGLLVLIDSMKARRVDLRRIPEVVEPIAASTARVAFSRESLQGVFDELYEAAVVEVSSASKWAGADPKREETIESIDPKTGKTKSARRFIYDMVRPEAPWLSHLLRSPIDNPWIKLWRDMVWAITRGINTTRAPFNRRAEDQPCAEGESAWQDLLKAEAKRAQGAFVTAPISGALMLSAQAVNAEGVPFSGRVEQNLLLHFWQVVVLTYVPQVIDDEGKPEAKGFVLAIPDVADLREFPAAYREMLDSLALERRGFRPASALIDLPTQSSLEFLKGLRDLAPSKASREDWARGVSAIESFHMLKLGNNIKLLAFDRVANRPGLIRKYERIGQTFRNPLFRAALLRALLREDRWFSGMIELFAERRWPFFVESDETPKFLPRFGGDARKQFWGILEDTVDMRPDEMSDDQRLARILHRLVNKYVEGRAEAKTGKKANTFDKETIDGKQRTIYPKEFREAQQRVCSDAFLAMRSRHDQDFVEFFAGSICSVPQALSRDDFAFLTKILMTRPDPNPVGPKALSWEDVKAVAMIAVSACSFATQPRETAAT